MNASPDGYRELYYNAPVAYLTLEPDLSISEANRRAATLLREERYGLVGRRLSDLLPAGDLQRLRNTLAKARESGSPRGTDLRFAVGETARTLHADVAASSAGPDAQGYRLGLTDISEQKRVEEELRQARRDLERRVEERTRALQEANAELRQEVQARQDIEDKLRRNQERLRQLAAELTNAEERQRRELAGYLHDLVAQTLAVAGMKLTAARSRVQDEEVRGMLSDTQGLIQEMTDTTRGILAELSPPILEEQDVPTAVSWLVDHANEKYRLRARVSVPEESLQLPDELKRFLYRSLRELLVNIAVHADTENAQVTLSRDQGSVTLIVEDDGRGFDVAEARRSRGFGIFSIQQRVEDLGGSFTLASRPGKGSSATLVLPLAPATT